MWECKTRKWWVVFFFAFHFLSSTKKKNLDRYLNLNIARAASPKKLGQWTKKAFELFTQKNIRRNLIRADHMRQIKEGTDVLHLPTAVGVLSDHFYQNCLFLFFLIINPLHTLIGWANVFFKSFFRTWCCGGITAGQEGGPKKNLRSAGGRFSCKARWKTSPIWWLQATTTNLCLAIQPTRCGSIF